METKHAMFMIAAQELNFTRAAEKAYVTQQCMSNYIRKLEKEYQAPLFIRSPRVALTDAGRALYEHLLRVQNLEHGLALELDSLRDGTTGYFRFGINSARARRPLAKILPEYYARFPGVRISISLNDTTPMCEMLRRGDLDLFLGIRTPTDDDFSISKVCDDDYYFVVSRQTLKKYFPNDYEQRIYEFYQDFSFHDADEIPLITNMYISNGIQLLEMLLQRKGSTYNINQHSAIQISDFETQFMICKRAPFIAFCPGLVTDIVIDLNRYETDPDQKLYLFPCEALLSSAPVQIVKLKDRAVPNYLLEFEKMLRDELLATKKREQEYMLLQQQRI